MIKICAVIAVLLIVTAGNYLPAQDAATDSKPVAVDAPESEVEAKESGGKPLEMTAAAIEAALTAAESITFRFSGEQVRMPVPSEVSVPAIAEVILAHSNSLKGRFAGYTLYAEPKSLVVSSGMQPASGLVLVVVRAMFSDLAKSPMHLNREFGNGLHKPGQSIAKTIEPDEKSIITALQESKDILIPVSDYVVRISLSDKSPRTELARTIEELIKRHPKITLHSRDKSLSVNSPGASFEIVSESLIWTLEYMRNAPLVSFTGTTGKGASGAPLPKNAIAPKHYTTSKNYVIAISEQRDRLWGYSRNLGKWSTFEFKSPFRRIDLAPSEEVFCAYNVTAPLDKDQRRHIWAFSSTTGRWDQLILPEDSKASPALMSDMIVVEDGDYVQIFSGATGKWSAPPRPDNTGSNPSTEVAATLPGDSKEGAGSEEAADGLQVRIMKLENTTAADAAAILQQLFRESKITIVPDPRTNALLISAPRATLETVEEVWRVLDASPASLAGSSSKGPSAALDDLKANAAQLKGRYQAQEKKAAALADTLRQTGRPSSAQKSGLRQLVSEAYVLRQQLHQAELALFQRRMATIQQTIQTRERIKDRVIDRRVEDLLNPELQWKESSPTDTTAKTITSTPVPEPVKNGAPGPLDLNEIHQLQAAFENLDGLTKSYSKEVSIAQAALAKGNGTTAVLEAAEAKLKAATQSLDVLRAQFAAKIRLLELDVQTAQSNFELRSAEFAEADNANRELRGTVNELEIQRLMTAKQLAEIKLKQATVLLELYQTLVWAIAPQNHELDAHTQAQQDLYDLMLAMHHYHDQHKHFPPAQVFGKDGQGEVPHSWRVEILPYLGEQGLYDAYHFEEPWDSEHNKTVLAKMPAVFRSPLDKADSLNTSYFAIVTPDFKGTPRVSAKAGATGLAASAGLGPMGPNAIAGLEASQGDGESLTPMRYDLGTVFSNPRGSTFTDITDGTANTIALVEAKRAVPWTKPEDVPYPADRTVPRLGGWFPEGWHAAFAEGSVKLILADNPEARIRAAFTIGGFEVAKLNVVPGNPRRAEIIPKPADRAVEKAATN